MVCKGDILELEIENMGSNGEGIAKADGFPVFVKDSVPGDLCLIKVTKVKKSFAYGHLLEVIKASKDRVAAICPVSKRCGGCAIQAVSYERQLSYKSDRVYDCLKRIGGIPDDILAASQDGTVGMEEPFRYRNKAQYPIGMDREGRVTAGFYAARSHSIVPVNDCLLLPEEFSGILKSVLDFIEANDITVYDEEKRKGLIRHLVLRKAFATGETMAVLVINGRSIPHEGELISILKRLDVKTALVNINRENTNVILGEKERILFGEGYITDELCGLRFRISAQSFYQVNPHIASEIYDTVLEYADLSGNEEVWDVCCGIGTISLVMAKKAGRVLGIEIVPDAIRDAKINAELNGSKNVEFICAAAEEELPDLIKDPAVKPVLTVLDPPRSGMERPALDAVIKASPQKIIYVSCDPATLARDVRILSQSGYELKRFRTYDQFCQTAHVETVVSLSLKSDSPKIEVSMKPGEDSLYEPQDKGTYKKIKAYILEKYGFKVSSLYIAQVKDKCGLDKERIGNAWKKSENTHVPVCPKEKEDAIMDAFRHFGLIDE